MHIITYSDRDMSWHDCQPKINLNNRVRTYHRPKLYIWTIHNFQTINVPYFAKNRKYSSLFHFQLYCAHEYTRSNLQFAHYIEKDNGDIQEMLSKALETDITVSGACFSIVFMGLQMFSGLCAINSKK